MQTNAPPEVGQTAPDFKLRGPGGQPVTLSEYQGARHVLLVFFPLAFSPVCTHQLPEIQQHFGRLQQLGAEVLGISVDSWYANQEFARKLNLSFPLLSDFDHAASTAYGMLIPEKRYSGRALFLVDRGGRIAWREIAPTPTEIPSTADALAALERLG